CTFLQGDAMALHRLLPEPVDYSLMANTFHGVPEQTALVREIAGVLKPGGLFAVVNWHARPRVETPVLGQARGPRTELRMTPEQVRAVVEAAGLRLDRVVELPPYHYGALFRLPG
ncbi:methyltransferase domain-containing protein, partial [Acidithiobacillus ferriphilus]